MSVALDASTKIDVKVLDQREEQPKIRTKNQIIFEVFKKTAIEAGVVFAIAGITAMFASTSAGVTSIIILAVCTVAANCIMRSIGAYINYRQSFKNEKETNGIISVLSASAFAFFFHSTGGVLVHECGHVIAMKTFLSSPTIKVTWTSFLNGFTKFDFTNLSRLGSLIGLNAFFFISSMSGPLLAVTVATAALVTGLWLRNSHQELSAYLGITGALGVVNHTYYALSALWKKADLANDFVALWKRGLHPVAAAVVILAVPIIASVAYLLIERCRHKQVSEKDKSWLAPIFDRDNWAELWSMMKEPFAGSTA